MTNSEHTSSQDDGAEVAPTRVVCACSPSIAHRDSTWVHTRLPAEATAVRELRRSIQDWTEAAEMDDEMAESVVLVVDEAVTNAVEHACPDWDCQVEVFAGPRGCEDGFAVLVADNGVWQAVGDPGYRGRGVALMARLADRCSVRASQQGTTVRMCWDRR